MDAAAAKFLEELAGIEEHYSPALASLDRERAEIVRKMDETRNEELAQIDLVKTIWAAQSERPGHIRQAAIVASNRLKQKRGFHINLEAARAILRL